MKIFSDFKAFIARGNVIDLAIGIMIGAAFNSIVKSFVDDILGPFVGYFTGKGSLKALELTIEANAETVTISYGKFLQASIDFLILAFIVFIIVKAIHSLKEKAEDPKNKSVPTPKDIQLLTEIRDLLKKD